MNVFVISIQYLNRLFVKQKNDQTENSYDYTNYDRYYIQNSAVDPSLGKVDGQDQIALNRIKAHATYLKDQGDLCQPTCVAKCGQMILADMNDL